MSMQTNAGDFKDYMAQMQSATVYVLVESETGN